MQSLSLPTAVWFCLVMYILVDFITFHVLQDVVNVDVAIDLHSGPSVYHHLRELVIGLHYM